MKTKYKDFLLYSLACVGAVSLFLSVSNKPSNEVGTYQIAVSNTNTLTTIYRLNTSTGDIVKIKKSNIGKINLKDN